MTKLEIAPSNLRAGAAGTASLRFVLSGFVSTAFVSDSQALTRSADPINGVGFHNAAMREVAPLKPAKFLDRLFKGFVH